MIKQGRNRAVVALVLALLLCLPLLPVACTKDTDPLEGLWELESGDMDVTHGEGTTFLEFKSNGEIEIWAEMPSDSEGESDSDFRIVRYHTIKIKYDIISEGRLRLSTTQLSETIVEDASFSLQADKLILNGERSGTLQFIRR